MEGTQWQEEDTVEWQLSRKFSVLNTKQMKWLHKYIRFLNVMLSLVCHCRAYGKQRKFI